MKLLRRITEICVIPLVAGGLLFASCSPKVIEKLRTEWQTQLVHHYDTVATKDSIYIKQWMKGDTVFIDRWRDHYFYRDRWRDSIQIKEVHDTTTVTKEVEKDLTFAQKAKINSFWWLLGTVILLLIWTFRKYILKLIKIC